MRKVLIVVVLCACGSAPPVQTVAPIGLPDAAESIAQQIPPGADSCVVARTGAVSSQRRSLVRRLSGAGPVAWDPNAPFVSYAEGVQNNAGRRSVRAIVRVTDLNAAKLYLENDAPVRVGFDDESCPAMARDCWRARELDARTLRLEFGPWDSEIAGAERACVHLARTHRRAIEVAMQRYWVSLEIDALPGFESEILLLPTANGLERIEVVDADVPTEEDIVLLVDLAENAERDRFEAASRRRRMLRGQRLHMELGFLWEDLELAAGDERRQREALAAEAESNLPLPVTEVDVRNLPLVRTQVSLHRSRLDQAEGARRRQHALKLQALLERARAMHPSDDALARQLVRVLLEELGDGAAAATVADEVLGGRPADPLMWRGWRRQALSLLGPDALVPALIEDGIADRRRASRAASTLAGFAGRDYEQAEGAWTAVQHLRALARRVRPVRGDVRIPSTAILETLLTLVDDDGPSRHVSVLMEVDHAVEHASWGDPEARVLTWPEDGHGYRYGAAPTFAPESLREIGRGLFHDLPAEVELEFTMAVVPMGGDLAEPHAAVRIRGQLVESEFRITAASTQVAGGRPDWAMVARYVAEPFSGLESRLFPPPDMELEARSESEAGAIVQQSLEEEAVLRCTRIGTNVECTVSPQLDTTRRAWRRVVWPLVTGRAISTR